MSFQQKTLSNIHSLFKKENNSTLVQLFKYTFAGGFAFLVDFGTLYLLTEYFKTNYLIAAGVGFIFGLGINYFLSIRWIFNKRSINNQLFEFIIFAIIGIVGLGLNELFLWILTELFFIYYLFSKLIVSLALYTWNFYARKLLLFNK